MTRRLFVAGVAGVLLSSHPHAFQRYSSATLGVRVDVLVTDGRTPVGGLSAADFELRDNGVVQHVEVIDSGVMPINAVLAFDVSASTEGRRRADLVTAGNALLDGLQPNDRAALVTFSGAVTPSLALTADVSLLRRQLAAVEPGGVTAMLDGVYTALLMTTAVSGRSLVVVFTDGYDTASWLQPQEVIEGAKRSNAVLYAVTAAPPRRRSGLADLADATGGHFIQIASTADLGAAFERVLSDFRSRYVLTYVPHGVAVDGYHRLQVRVISRRGLNIRTRPGYIGLPAAIAR